MHPSHLELTFISSYLCHWVDGMGLFDGERRKASNCGVGVKRRGTILF